MAFILQVLESTFKPVASETLLEQTNPKQY
jgi:hypothetical protein